MLIADSDALAHCCARLRDAPWAAIDTEFVREKTYYPKLCLVQLAGPDAAPAAVDTLADGIDLAPLFDLLGDPAVEKIFHAASQDFAVLLRAAGALPAPVYDTQVAAAFCGYGEQVGYAGLAERVAGASIDKGSQLTDWTRRPLTDRQLAYALSDVEHLGAIHAHLVERLAALGRTQWAAEEMAILADPSLHDPDPREQWRRVRLRRPKPRTLAILREVATWREETARARDLPRGWVLKDDALAEIAANAPDTRGALERVRTVTPKIANGRDGAALLEAVARGRAVPDSECPRPPEPRKGEDKNSLVALLRALLETRCETHELAPALVANRDDLERIARGDDDVRALAGWRRALWGEDALALRAGRIALAASGEGISVVRLEGDGTADP